jgi:PAS domain S-box-containing protein
MLKAIKKVIGLNMDEGEHLYRRYRILILLCGPAYAIWMQAFKYAFIPFFNVNGPSADDIMVTPFLTFLIDFGTIFFPLLTVAMVISSTTKRVERNLYIAYQVMIYAISFHYFLMVNEAHLHKLFIMGTFVLVFSVSYMMATARSGAAYMIFILLCGIVLVNSSGTENPKGLLILGQVTMCIFAFVAIADRRRIELKDKSRIAELTKHKEQLRESEELIRLSVDATGVATWRFDVKSDIVTGSPQYFKHLGLPENTKTITNTEVINKYIHPDDLNILSESFARVFEHKIGETIEFRMITVKGETRWFEGRGYVYQDATGAITGLLGTTTDITEKKIIEFKERNSRERLDLALSAGQMGTFDHNLKKGTVNVSQSFSEMCELNTREFPMMDFTAIILDGDRERFAQDLGKTIADGACNNVFEFRVNTPTKGQRWILAFAKIFYDPKSGVPVRVVGVIRDITEAKAKEEMILKNADQLREAQYLAKVGSWEWDLEANTMVSSEVSQQIYGVGPGANDRNIIYSLIHESDREHTKQVINHAVANSERYEIQYRVVVNGVVKNVRAAGRPIVREGKTIGYLGSVQDITAQVLMLEEARQQSEIFNMTLKAANLAHWSWNPTSNELTFDTEWFKGIDVLGDDTRLETWMAAVHPEDGEKVGIEIAKHLAGETEVYECMMRLKARAGGYKHILAKGKIIERDEAGNPIRFSGVHVDLTEMMLLRSQIEGQRAMLTNQAQLSALGEMASGIAHEINTPVSGIKLRTSTIRRSLSKGKVPHDLDHLLQEVNADVDRCSSIISGLKLLSRDPSKLPKENFDPCELVKHTLSLCRTRMMSKGIKIKVDDESAKGLKAHAVPTMVLQVLVNLMNNAMDAVNDDSIVEKEIKIRVYPYNAMIYMTVEDSGAGIPLEARDKIFLPFFTTKEVGKGTGLGLSISKSIMENHSGNLKLISKVGEHTKFLVSIPIASANESAA